MTNSPWGSKAAWALVLILFLIFLFGTGVWYR